VRGHLRADAATRLHDDRVAVVDERKPDRLDVAIWDQYGVRIRIAGTRSAPVGRATSVASRTPSRIGTITRAKPTVCGGASLAPASGTGGGSPSSRAASADASDAAGGAGGSVQLTTRVERDDGEEMKSRHPGLHDRRRFAGADLLER
jgi:hypothetical protein